MGILNIGNTCYLASALQCIVSTDGIHRYIQETDQSNVVIDVYRDLHQRVRQNVGSVDPTRMFNIIKKHCSNFKDNEQNDAHEALIIILEILSKSFETRFDEVAMYPHKDFNIVDEVFKMVTENVVFCDNCNHELINYESSYGLLHQMDANIKYELPEYVCDCCKRVNTSYQMARVVRYPQTLIILNPSVKTETFLFGNHTYETFAICNYTKLDIRTGHYNVIVRDSERWVLKDDCVTTTVHTNNFKDMMKDASFILTHRKGRHDRRT